MNIFVKRHSFNVYESKLVAVLRVLAVLGVKVRGMDRTHIDYEDQWNVTIEAASKDWKRVRREIERNTQLKEACNSFI